MPVSPVSDTRRCLVIGSAGFLGSALVRLVLAERNQKNEPLYSEVVALDRVASSIDAEIPTGDRARLITRVGDITKFSEIDSYFQDIDTVFHLASVVYVGLQRRPVLQQVNVDGARNVCELCVKHKVKRLIYTSSTDTVLDTIPRTGANEETAAYPKNPMNDYVRTKVEGERIVLSYNGKNGLQTCSLRPTHLYGPRDPHAIKHSISMFKQGKVPILLGDGSALFGVIYVDNIAYAHILADNDLAQKGASSLVAGNFYFIGEDNNINYFDFLRPFAKQKGVQMPKIKLPFWLIMIIATLMELLYWLATTLKFNWEPAFHRFHCYVIAQDFYFSCAKAQREFGYKPLVSKEEGLKRTLAWFDKEEV